MRDGQVYKMQEANARRAAMLFGQWEFLETRQRAFEVVFKASAFWERVGFIINPMSFIKAVDAKQIEFLEDGRRKAQAAAERVREEARKPKLTIISASGNGAIHG